MLVCICNHINLVGCGPKGKITVTDMDSIEVSNLSRQFLFREEHVGKMKSAIAAESACKMNPEMNVVSMQDKVAPDTEDIFDDKFFEDLDGVMNALDNVEARVYVDSRCLFFKKPLLESGTLGTKGHVQVIVPYVTESYGSKRDAENKEFPKCTIHQFPNLIQHTITWARELFSTMFNSTSGNVNTFLQDREEFLKQANNNLSSLDTIHNALIRVKPTKYQDCIAWARVQFEQLFNYTIRDILLAYPPDKKTSSGGNFWSGTKRCPTNITFDAKDATHMQFIEAAAHLFAVIYKVPVIENLDYVSIAMATAVPPYVAQDVPSPDELEGKLDEEKKKQLEQEKQERDQKNLEQNQAYVAKVLTDLNNLNVKEMATMTEVEFEKDDETNFHMDFITAASNLRARSYKIPEADKHKTKGIGMINHWILIISW